MNKEIIYSRSMHSYGGPIADKGKDTVLLNSKKCFNVKEKFRHDT